MSGKKQKPEGQLRLLEGGKEQFNQQ